MKKQIIAIGGGGLAKPKNLDIESYIVDNARVRNPKTCFIPTATGEINLTLLIFTEHSVNSNVIHLIWSFLRGHLIYIT